MSEPLDDAAIKDALGRLAGWTHEGHKLHKTFKLDGFPSAVAFITRIGFDAEAAQHHPEIRNVYSTVEIALTTHDAGNKVTAQDVAMAEAIDKAAAGR